MIAPTATAMGFFKEYANARGLALGMDADPEVVTETLKEYGKVPDPFGKSVFPVKFSPEETLRMCLSAPSCPPSLVGLVC